MSEWRRDVEGQDHVAVLSRNPRNSGPRGMQLGDGAVPWSRAGGRVWVRRSWLAWEWEGCPLRGRGSWGGPWAGMGGDPSTGHPHQEVPRADDLS